MNDFDWDNGPSKSKRKREAENLQEIGVKLLDLPENLFASLSLPEDLANAIADAKKIKSKNAYRRQLQFIGRVMRRVDGGTINEIERAIQQWQVGNRNQRQAHKNLESNREALITGDETLLQQYLQHESCDKQVFVQTLRQAKSEDKANHRGKAYRKLFQLIRELS